jgi:hypothetical protein
LCVSDSIFLSTSRWMASRSRASKAATSACMGRAQQGLPM